MSLSRQTPTLTKHYRGGVLHTLRYSFFVRVLWIVIVLIALMAVTIGTYQGTENLIEWYFQWSI